MICLNPKRHTMLICFITLICLWVLSLMLALAYMMLTVKKPELWFLLFSIVLYIAFFFLMLVFNVFPVKLLLHFLNQDLIYISDRYVRFTSGNFQREIPKAEVSMISLQNNVITVFTKEGDIFAEARCNHYAHVKKIVKKFGYRYYTSEPWEYIPVDETNIHHVLKSEAHFRNVVSRYGGNMSGLDIEESNNYFARNNIIYKQGKERPMIRFARHLINGNAREYDDYCKSKLSLKHPILFIILPIYIIGLEIIYYLFWGRNTHLVHIDSNMVYLGYIIYPFTALLELILAYRWLRSHKVFEITEDEILIRHKKKLHSYPKHMIRMIVVDHAKFTIYDEQRELISISLPEYYSLFYDLEMYQYPFTISNITTDKIKWYPGIPIVTAEANGFAKGFMHLEIDNESLKYNPKRIEYFSEHLKQFGIEPIKQGIRREMLVINKGEQHGRDIYL